MANTQENINLAQRGDADGSDTVSEKQELIGYPKLARLMSHSSETAIFRRFKELNMINLLRLQAELHDLEHQLQDIRDDDGQSGDLVRASYATDFRAMRDWKETGDSLQYDLLVSIGDKLQQYNAALSQALELSKAEAPNRREVEFLRCWLIKPSEGKDFLKDIEQTIWDEVNSLDLVTLFPRMLQRDFFTSFLNGHLLDIYDRIWGHRRKQASTPFPETSIRQYNEARIATISNSVGAILSSLLPTVAILALYFVHSMLLRIGLTIIFTSVFSLALSLFTEAKKVEIFSATAAFAAVEVVFIGTSTNSTG